MKIIWQPQGPRTCGQTCVAMLAGRTTEQVIRHLGGRKGGTRTKHLVTLLRGYHFYVPQGRLTRYRGTLPEIAICKLAKRRKSGRISGAWHWVLWAENRFWDPSDPLASTLDDFKKYDCSELTSYLEVKR